MNNGLTKMILGITIIIVGAVYGQCHADSNTQCWTDANGNIHCTTTESSKDDITPKGAY